MHDIYADFLVLDKTTPSSIASDGIARAVSLMPTCVGFQHQNIVTTTSDSCIKSPPPAPATIRWHIGQTIKGGMNRRTTAQIEPHCSPSSLAEECKTAGALSTFDLQHRPRHSFRQARRSRRVTSADHQAQSPSACHADHDRSNRLAHSIPHSQQIWRPDNFNDHEDRLNNNNSSQIYNYQGGLQHAVYNTTTTARRQFNVRNLRVYKSIRKQRHASVQLCRDIVTGVDAVLKVLYRPVRSKDDDVAREFHIQSEVHGHPNIARVLHAERVGHDIQLGVIQICEQGDVLQMIPPNVGMSPVQALPIIKDAAEALRFMHDKRIAHGDFKPDNICITNEGEVKLIDFGLAQHIDDPNKTIGLGTPVYMAPELHQQYNSNASGNTFQLPTPSSSSSSSSKDNVSSSSKDNVSSSSKDNASFPVSSDSAEMEQQQNLQHEPSIDLRAADVFAFGISLFCILTGRFPWHSATPGNVDYTHFAQTGCPPPLQAAHFLQVHEAFEPLIYNTLRCNPSERWNMRQVCGFLGHIQI